MADRTAAGTAAPWYNEGPNATMHILGSKSATSVGDQSTQRFFAAVNKRLIKNWMGELRYMARGDAALLAALTDWFGTEDGKKHFRGWAQKLGCQIGNRPNDRKGPHLAQKAMDINYQFNAWCPLCGDGFVMTGEPGTERWWPLAGRLYDRVLRIFVPVEIANDDPDGARRFARLFYRVHSDWTPLTTGDDSQPPLSIEAVYQRYQTLNWSIRFYFDHMYQQIAIVRKDDDRAVTTINQFSTHSPTRGEQVPVRQDADHSPANPSPPPSPREGADLWASIATDIANGRLPPTSEFVCDEASVPLALRAGIFAPFAGQIHYPFEARPRNVYRIPLTAAQATTITAQGSAVALGSAMATQIRTDHDGFANALRYTGVNRDPCNGIFNYCYEFILAVGRMLSDAREVRAFGAFATTSGGDMQHFDYGYKGRG